MTSKREKIIKQNLETKFTEVDAGWIFFNLKLGKQKNKFKFSHVYDPIVDFKHWLEAIAIGVEQCSFVVDCEGLKVKFDLESMTWENSELRITEFWENDNYAKMVGYVDRKQIVKSLYLGLLNFRESKKFAPDEWEIEYYWERAAKLTKLRNKEVLSFLIQLKREEILLFLNNIKYNQEQVEKCMSIPLKEKKNSLDLLKLLNKHKINNKGFLNLSEVYWNLEKDFDKWGKAEKKERISDIMNEYISSFHGTRISDFKSKIIEDYLGNEE